MITPERQAQIENVLEAMIREELLAESPKNGQDGVIITTKGLVRAATELARIFEEQVLTKYTVDGDPDEALRQFASQMTIGGSSLGTVQFLIRLFEGDFDA